MIGTILLTKSNMYLCDDSLPIRPWFDKEYLTKFYTGAIISYTGFKMLPPSITRVTKSIDPNPTHAVTIRELGNCDVLYIVRATGCKSVESTKGTVKTFRLDNFKQISKGEIELWIKK